MKKLVLIAVALSLSACATCQRYPVACAVGYAVLVGSALATLEANRHGRAPGIATVTPPDCKTNPAICR